jgi:hypothetical protein
LYLEDVTVPPDAPHRFGGFGDVYRGFLDGRSVAVKKARVFVDDPFARKVCL